MRALVELTRFWAPWEAALRSHMPSPVAKVAVDKCPDMMAAMAVLLQWPDQSIGVGFVQGFQLLGRIEAPHIFKSIEPRSSLRAKRDNGCSAEAVSALEQRLPQSWYAEELLQHTVEEIKKGWAEGFFSKSELDLAFRPNRWLPMHRFMHVQPCGKLRPIDNGGSAGHNELAWATETIITNTADFAAAVFRELMRVASQGFQQWSPWLLQVFGTHDMASAYREIPNVPHEAPALVIGIWHPGHEAVRYAIMRAHPFGLASAVLNFNRFPALATAVVRQCTSTAAAAYFDDTGVFDLACNRGSGQECVWKVYTCLGAALDPAKQQPMASQRCCLGVLLNFAGVVESLQMQLDLKPGLRESLKLEIEKILESGTLSAGQAAKLRGRPVGLPEGVRAR